VNISLLLIDDKMVMDGEGEGGMMGSELKGGGYPGVLREWAP